jgi:hypothetical protein
MKSIKRFPRLEVSSKMKWVEGILHTTYNRTARGKNFKLRNFNYDIYNTKQGWRAQLRFLQLAEKLIAHNINPALYIKVMARFGPFKNLRYMPHPTWLAKDKNIRNFKWFYRTERKSYPLKLDWKKALDGWSDLDIYAAIRDSAEMLNFAVLKTGMGIEEAFMMLRKEISPWFLAVHVRKSSDWKDFLRCLEFFGRPRHGGVRKIAYKAYQRTFKQ